MPSPKPTIVIVHGGWHDPSCFDMVRKPLETEGYKCHVPALPSIGHLSATKTASDDVKLVHGIVEDCITRGENVIVVGHSNGGLKANGALKGLVGGNEVLSSGRGKVLGLGMIAGLLPPVEKMGASQKASQQPTEQDRWIFSDTEPTMLPRDPTKLFYNDMPADEAAYWTSRIRPMHTQEMPSGYHEAWRHLPVSYLVCTKDNGISELQQLAIIDAAKEEGGTVYATRVAAGHSPFLTRPEEVVEWIRHAAKQELLV